MSFQSQSIVRNYRDHPFQPPINQVPNFQANKIVAESITCNGEFSTNSLSAQNLEGNQWTLNGSSQTMIVSQVGNNIQFNVNGILAMQIVPVAPPV